MVKRKCRFIYVAKAIFCSPHLQKKAQMRGASPELPYTQRGKRVYPKSFVIAVTIFFHRGDNSFSSR